MGKLRLILLNFIVVLGINAQEVELPGDFRQHNLTTFNASLLNPTFALDQNRPQSIALWTRWQWQTVDRDPTTTFINYTTSLNENSVIGGGFLQHNTGVYLQTGGILNYAHAFEISENAKLALGINVLGFQREIADDRFASNGGINMLNADSNEFIMQFAPGITLMLDAFSLSVASENIVEISSNNNVNENRKKVFLGAMAYDFPVQLFGGTAGTSIRPMLYLKSIPEMETQLGFNALLTSQRFWAQGGYNSFYGASAGVGGIFLKSLSIGILVEFGLDQSVKDKDATFELVTAIRFGNKKETEILPQEIEITQEIKNEKEEARERKDLLKNEEKVIESKKQAAIPKEKTENIKTAETKNEDALKKEQPSEPRNVTKGKYEEVGTLEGLQPGYYLIANVFGTKKYLDNFMVTLRKNGLEPKSFYRPVNKLNYVYLGSYDSLESAEKARDSKFYGRYTDETWIFRVIGN